MSGAGYGAATNTADPLPASAMTLRESFRPLRPDLDGFLFAQVGNEFDGVPLSVISALTRLGLDPWEEAGRLAAFSAGEATEQLARLIADLPGHAFRLHDARGIAAGLVTLLPRGRSVARPEPTRFRRGLWPVTLQMPSRFWIACAVIGVAALVSVVINHGFPFGIGSL